jgi:Mg-chelatase subunit ChlD
LLFTSTLAFLTGACSDYEAAGADARVSGALGKSGQVSLALSLSDPNGDPIPYDEKSLSARLETREPGGAWVAAENVRLEFKGPLQLDVVVVADNSASERGALPTIQDSVRHFARQIQMRAAGDRVGLVRVSTVASLLQDLTYEVDAFHAATEKMSITNGWTALWDGVRLGNEVLDAAATANAKGNSADVCFDRSYPALVVFTDGRDNNSADEHQTRYTGDGINTQLSDLLQLRVRGTPTAVHTVGVGSNVDQASLDALSNASGGLSVNVDHLGKLHGALSSAANRMGAQVPVCFKPTSCDHREGRLTVRITRKAAPPIERTVQLALPQDFCDHGKR